MQLCGVAHRVCIKFDPKTGATQNRKLAIFWRQVGFFHDVPFEKMVHNLVAIVQIGQGRRNMIGSCRGSPL